MTKEDLQEYRPSKVEMLASLVSGTANQSHTMATVQRSHRFPVYLFDQIENLAKHGNVPVSLIINELIECGLEALKQELPEDVLQRIVLVTDAQMKRPTITEKFDSNEYRAAKKGKSRPE